MPKNNQCILSISRGVYVYCISLLILFMTGIPNMFKMRWITVERGWNNHCCSTSYNDKTEGWCKSKKEKSQDCAREPCIDRTTHLCVINYSIDLYLSMFSINWNQFRTMCFRFKNTNFNIPCNFCCLLCWSRSVFSLVCIFVLGFHS